MTIFFWYRIRLELLLVYFNYRYDAFTRPNLNQQKQKFKIRSTNQCKKYTKKNRKSFHFQFKKFARKIFLYVHYFISSVWREAPLMLLETWHLRVVSR